MSRSAVLSIAAAVLVAACGGEGESGGGGTAGGVVTPARANWESGYFQAAVYSELLRELGYDVADESAAEMGPDLFYPSLAGGDYDYWVNGWFPIHDRDLETEVVEGGTVGDHVQAVGFEVEAGALQGFLIDKPTADEHGIETLAQIVEDEGLRTLFDLNADGTADLIGCDRSWGCAEVIDETIALNGWEGSLTQVQDDYALLFEDVVDRIEAGRPSLYYTWAPNYTVAVLVPGTDVVWLGLGADTMPGQDGVTDMDAGLCTAAPCQTGFAPADIRVVANNDFLDANPAAARLFELVVIPATDIYAQNLAMHEGADTQPEIVAAARGWIDEHRATVDEWLEEARREGGL